MAFHCEHSTVFLQRMVWRYNAEWVQHMSISFSIIQMAEEAFLHETLISWKHTEKGFSFLPQNLDSICRYIIFTDQTLWTQWTHLISSSYFCSCTSDGWWQAHIAHGSTLNLCVFTFSAVCSVVQRRWVSIVVWQHLFRRAPDPVKAIPEGELIPAARTTLKVTLSGWMSREIRIYLYKVETESLLLTLETAADTTISLSRWNLLICHGISIFLSTKYICFCVFWKLQNSWWWTPWFYSC